MCIWFYHTWLSQESITNINVSTIKLSKQKHHFGHLLFVARKMSILFDLFVVWFLNNDFDVSLSQLIAHCQKSIMAIVFLFFFCYLSHWNVELSMNFCLDFKFIWSKNVFAIFLWIQHTLCFFQSFVCVRILFEHRINLDKIILCYSASQFLKNVVLFEINVKIDSISLTHVVGEKTITKITFYASKIIELFLYWMSYINRFVFWSFFSSSQWTCF